MKAEAAAYRPKDVLHLWWLQDPAHPRAIGELRLVLGGRGVGLHYAAEWLRSGFPLSEDLPLADELFVPAQKDTVAGAVDDARPDRWGERVIRRFEPSPRLSLMEFLLFAGDDRYGALGVSESPGSYQPWPSAPVPTLASLAQMADAVRRILANEPVPELQRRLLRPGVSLGGARPKSLVMIDGEPWLVKFSEGEDLDTELVEHATMTLAGTCGIILVDNTDDHEKNHALLRQADGAWLLAPAFDVLPSAQGLGAQALIVGDAGAEADLHNALSQARAFGLKAAAAREIVRQVARKVQGWKDHFRAVGVRAADIDVLAQYIDGERLGGQRRAFAS